jgi:hypothetical protein
MRLRPGLLGWRPRKRRLTPAERDRAEQLRLEREPLVCRIATGSFRRRVAIAAATPSSTEAVSSATRGVGGQARRNESKPTPYARANRERLPVCGGLEAGTTGA